MSNDEAVKFWRAALAEAEKVVNEHAKALVAAERPGYGCGARMRLVGQCDAVLPQEHHSESDGGRASSGIPVLGERTAGGGNERGATVGRDLR